MSVLLGLFFASFAAGSLHTATEEFRWRNAVIVRGVLIKRGTRYHYEYTPAGGATVIGPDIGDQWTSKPDGVIDDWIRLEYDPQLPQRLRAHLTKGRAESNYKQSAITAATGSVFILAALACVWTFLRALHEKRGMR